MNICMYIHIYLYIMFLNVYIYKNIRTLTCKDLN